LSIICWLLYRIYKDLFAPHRCPVFGATPARIFSLWMRRLVGVGGLTASLKLRHSGQSW
jgi:hypothetical protein